MTVTDAGTYLSYQVSLGPKDGPGSVEGLLGAYEGTAKDFQLADPTPPLVSFYLDEIERPNKGD